MNDHSADANDGLGAPEQLWVLYAYTDTAVLPTFHIDSRDQYERFSAGHPADYRLVGYFRSEVQCRTEVARDYVKCSRCDGLILAAAAVQGTCPSCCFYAVKEAGGDDLLGLAAAQAWADAWRARVIALPEWEELRHWVTPPRPCGHHYVTYDCLDCEGPSETSAVDEPWRLA